MMGYIYIYSILLVELYPQKMVDPSIVFLCLHHLRSQCRCAAAKVPQSLTSHEANGGPRRRQPGRPAAGGLEAFLKNVVWLKDAGF